MLRSHLNAALLLLAHLHPAAQAATLDAPSAARRSFSPTGGWESLLGGGLPGAGSLGQMYGGGASPSKASGPSQGSSNGCPSYYMIGARGTFEGPSGSIAYNGVYEKVLAAVPGGEKQELQYSTSMDYTTTVVEGAQTEVKLIEGVLSKCPQAVLVLLGYSKGAMVQTQALENPQVPGDRVAAVVLFGNPYFRAGAPQNRCGSNVGMGVAAMMGNKLPEGLADRVYDCCAPGDSICQTGAIGMAHLSYAQHQEEVVSFVVERLQAKLGGSSSGAQRKPATWR